MASRVAYKLSIDVISPDPTATGGDLFQDNTKTIADLLETHKNTLDAATASNTVSTIVKRDSGGSFECTGIGNAGGNLTLSADGDIILTDGNANVDFSGCTISDISQIAMNTGGDIVLDNGDITGVGVLTGTFVLADQRISSNVGLKNMPNTWASGQTFSSACSFVTNTWHTATDATQRIYFGSGSTNFYKSGVGASTTSAHTFRNVNDTAILTIGGLGNVAATGALTGGVVTLMSGVTPALNAASGNTFTLTVGNAVTNTIAVPTNPVAGQKIIIAFLASGADRTIALNTGAGGFRLGSLSITATTNGTTDYIGAIYNAYANKWDVVAIQKGY